MTSPKSRDFRPEIQALRAVAVLLVLTFHLWPDHVPGGYVGVDVFFVISGFLITSHLAREAEASGTVRLTKFWARRIRRLLPAASLVLIVSLVAMFALVPRSIWQRTVTEIGASAVYVLNWVLSSNSVDYLNIGNEPTLVQHYWSLSVEEQFYIAWPLLMLGAFFVFRKLSRRRAVVAALVAVFVTSLAFSIYETIVNPPSAYFNTFARAWEFAAGGLLAFVPGLRGRVAAAIGTWAGIAAIVIAAVAFSSSTPFPGIAAALPVAGAMAFIVAGSAGGAWALMPVVRSRPVQLIGDLSYGIYLWHWPLIVLAPFVLAHDLRWRDKLVIVAATVALAWLTRVVLEGRLARNAAWASSTRIAYVFAIVTIAAVVSTSVITAVAVRASNQASAQAALDSLQSDPCYGEGAIARGANECPSPFAVPPDLDTSFAAADVGLLEDKCYPQDGDSRIVSCDYGQLDAPTLSIAIVGNSHAAALVPALDVYGAANGWKVTLMRKTGCLGVEAHSTEAGVNPDCVAWSQNVLDRLITSDDFDVVIFASHRDVADAFGIDRDAPAAEFAGVRRTVSDNFAGLVESGLTVIVLGDVPGSQPYPAPQCVEENREQYDPCASGLKNSGQSVETRAAQSTPGVEYVDLTPFFCDDSECHVVIGGVVVYSDAHHLTGTFARSLAPYLGARLELAFGQP